TVRWVVDRFIRTLPGGAQVRIDGAGRHRETVNTLGQATTFQYDAGGRLEAIVLPHTGATYDFQYSGAGTSLAAVSPWGPTVGTDRVVTLTRDASRRVLTIRDADTTEVRFEYDGSTARVLKRRDRLGWFTRFTYATGNKLSFSRVPAAVGETIGIAY